MFTATKRNRSRHERELTRSRGKLVVVSAATLMGLYFCYRLAQPFLPVLVWAVTGAVVTRPMLHWLTGWIQSPSWRALVAVTIVAIGFFAPMSGIMHSTTVQIVDCVQDMQTDEYVARWQTLLEDNPRFATTWQRVSQTFDLRAAMERSIEQVRNTAMAVLSGSAYSLAQALVTLFILFYLYRDQETVLDALRRLSPLSTRETNRLLSRLDDMIHATVFGTVAVAIVQGVLGGFIFWLLGFSNTVLLGTIMGLLAIVPYLGAFVVWVPAALFLFMEGHWVQALVLVGWGTIVIGLIDNLLYPILVGKRLQQHTVIAFLAIVGGVAVFGALGIIFGPVIVSLTVFLLDVWRRRTDRTSVAETV